MRRISCLSSSIGCAPCGTEQESHVGRRAVARRHCGNGYNLYKAYQWLKAADSLHLVTYRDAQGQWNSDFDFPATRDGRTYLNSAAAQKQPAAKPKGKASARRR